MERPAPFRTYEGKETLPRVTSGYEAEPHTKGAGLLSSASGPVVCAYEAGSVGYAPQRELRRLGVDCQVIAPSLVPIRPGDRLKTDRRDACKLAGLLRAGELVEVSPPTPEEEAVRDLCRAREDANDIHNSR